MIAVDTNILVYSHRAESTWYEQASAKVRALAESRTPWAIPWPCVHEFLGVVTNQRVFEVPTPLPVALAQVEFWRESSSLNFLSERFAYWPVLRDTLAIGKIAGARVHDARIHAICKENGVTTLWSADRDFNRFTGLKIVNPLVSN